MRKHRTGYELINPWLVALLLVAPGMLSAKDAPTGLPDVVVDEPFHDAGIVGPNTTVSHRFQLTNDGEAALIIHRISPGCDSRVNLVGERIIAPGEARGLYVAFEALLPPGVQGRRVEIHSNDPHTPRLKVELSAKVVEDYALMPPSLFFHQVHGIEPAAQYLKLRRFNDSEMKIKALDPSESWLSATWKRLADEKGFSIKVDVGAGAPVGSHMEVLSIYFEDADKQAIDVPVLVKVAEAADTPAAYPAAIDRDGKSTDYPRGARQ